MVQTRMLRWRRLPQAERASLEPELRALFRGVFAGLDRDTEDSFVRTLDEVALYRADDGRLVGFNGLRFVAVTPPGGRPTTAMVHLAAMLPEHRGGNRSIQHVMRVGWRHWIRSGFRPFYYCCRLIHPSPFRLFVRFPDRAYPTPLRPHDPDAQALLEALVPQLGYQVEPNAAGYLVTLPKFRVAAEHRAADAAGREDPITRWFDAQVPAWREGQGLMVVIPLDLRAAVLTTPRVLFRRPRTLALPPP